MTDARRIVYDALLLAEDKEATFRLASDVLDKYSYLDQSDRSFIKRLIEGVTERRITLDHVISSYSSIPVSKMKKQIRTLLRMGTYQLLFMDGTADHAAVNETVKLAKKTGFVRLAGFVNGVLRSISTNKDSIPWPDEAGDPVKYMSVMYSCPEWIVSKLIKEQGSKNAEDILKLSVSTRAVTARVNLSKTSVKAVTDGGCAVASDICDCAVVLKDYDNITGIPAFIDGSIIIQDLSSMLAVIVAGIKETDTVLDLCASPGGKSLHAADLAKRGRVISCDVSERKISKIKENALRCGFDNIDIRISDATVYNEEFEEAADVVIADVPCSGLGVMGRKNDIKYNITEESILSLTTLQRQILENAARYVKKGGTLLFSTCTCSECENNDNVRYLTEECHLKSVDFHNDIPDVLKNDTAREGYLQLYGRDGITDGFFMAKFEK